ncbi:MAG: AMP-binding protein [Rhodospirillaceae bacterium]|nr:AMP-binding protein [Rhodospirillaceae bacterium]
MHTLADPLRHAARNYAGSPATICGDVRLNFRELTARCHRLGGALQGLGLKTGDRIAILAANSHQYIETYMTVPAAGYVVVPLNTRHAEAELAYALEDSGTKILLTDVDPGGLADIVERVIRIPDDYEALLGEAEEIELGTEIDEQSLAGLFYTGGTTGASKGVMLSHRNLIANSHNWTAFAQPRRDDIKTVMAPLFHAAGSNSVIASIWSGGVQMIIPQFIPAQILDLIEKERATQMLGVPIMIAALAEEQHANPRDVSSVRFVAHGGSPITTEVVRRAIAAFPGAEFAHLYGATETGPLITGLHHEERIPHSDLLRSCGQPLPGIAIRIVDREGNEIAAGEVGEVEIGGPNIMQGYWNKPEQTAAALQGGWYLSGDLGYVDDNNSLFLMDRAKDMIITGAENVYCTEVEEVLHKHPAVLQAAVFGIPDKKWGEAVHAAIQLRHPTEAEELIAFCHEHIAGYKVPKGIDFWDKPLPLSGPGKILKRELRKPYWAEEGKQIS